jgi:hypothetical protein
MKTVHNNIHLSVHHISRCFVNCGHPVPPLLMKLFPGSSSSLLRSRLCQCWDQLGLDHRGFWSQSPLCSRGSGHSASLCPRTPNTGGNNLTPRTLPFFSLYFCKWAMSIKNGDVHRVKDGGANERTITRRGFHRVLAMCRVPHSNHLFCAATTLSPVIPTPFYW